MDCILLGVHPSRCGGWAWGSQAGPYQGDFLSMKEWLQARYTGIRTTPSCPPGCSGMSGKGGDDVAQLLECCGPEVKAGALWAYSGGRWVSSRKIPGEMDYW